MANDVGAKSVGIICHNLTPVPAAVQRVERLGFN